MTPLYESSYAKTDQCFKPGSTPTQYFTVLVTIGQSEDATGTTDPAGAEIKIPMGSSRAFAITPATGSYIA